MPPLNRIPYHVATSGTVHVEGGLLSTAYHSVTSCMQSPTHMVNLATDNTTHVSARSIFNIFGVIVTLCAIILKCFIHESSEPLSLGCMWITPCMHACPSMQMVPAYHLIFGPALICILVVWYNKIVRVDPPMPHRRLQFLGLHSLVILHGSFRKFTHFAPCSIDGDNQPIIYNLITIYQQ